MVRRIGSGCGGGRGGETSMAEEAEEAAVKPAWLQGLTEEKTFFAACGDHYERKKNEKNIFCLACRRSICPHCLPFHPSHPLLQVRRYVYHEVVRLDDLQKLVDCSYVQPYTINGAKVIFLNYRPQSRPCKGSANFCFTCGRILQHPFHFCSLSCKVDHLVNKGEDLSTILYSFDESDFSISQFEGLPMDLEDNAGQMSTSSMLDVSMPCKVTCSNDATNISEVSSVGPEDAVVRGKKKGSRGLLGGIDVFSFGSRRKGAPHRSPLS